MKSNNVKLKGKLRTYLYWPLILTILLVLMNIPVYMKDVLSGVMVSMFTAVYFGGITNL